MFSHQPASFSKEKGEGAGGNIPSSPPSMGFSTSGLLSPAPREVQESPFYHSVGIPIMILYCRCIMSYLTVYIPKISRQQSIQVGGYKQKREDKKNKLSYRRTVSINNY